MTKKLLPKVYPVTCHTDHVGAGSTFVAIRGRRFDGADYISLAIGRGATQIVLDADQIQTINPDLLGRATFTIVPDTRIALAEYAARALGYPSKKLTIIGVTGTKGKTTTTTLVHHLLTEAGIKAGLMGTVCNKLGSDEYASSLTTAAADEMQMFFATAIEQGITHMVMEVSSHALMLERLHGTEFSIACFTNFAADHQDFHGSIEAYFRAKQKLFTLIKSGGQAIFNIDDDYGRRAALETASSVMKMTYGTQHSSMGCPHVLLKVNETSLQKTAVTLVRVGESCQLESAQLLGSWNGHNIALASIIAQQLGITTSVIQKAVSTFPGVPGRFEVFRFVRNISAIVDFAHNALSMASVLKFIRPHAEQLIVVFGCGGNRDPLRRSQMGSLSAQYADQIIITDDNPRTESAATIAQQILAGIPPHLRYKATIIHDRTDAIRHAFLQIRSGGVIAVLGKGHESYQEIHGVYQLHHDPSVILSIGQSISEKRDLPAVS